MTEGTCPLVWRPDVEKVLIVHESAAFRAALRCQLASAGFHCIEARDALAGLQRAFEDRPDALIIDADLSGLDGIAMRGVLANDRATRDLPVLLCDAEGMIEGMGGGRGSRLASRFTLGHSEGTQYDEGSPHKCPGIESLTEKHVSPSRGEDHL